MSQSEARASTVVWRGTADYRHLALIMESTPFRSKICSQLNDLGYMDVDLKSIEAVNPQIEELVIALGISAKKDGSDYSGTIHVKMDGMEITFP